MSSLAMMKLVQLFETDRLNVEDMNFYYSNGAPDFIRLLQSVLLLSSDGYFEKLGTTLFIETDGLFKLPVLITSLGLLDKLYAFLDVCALAGVIRLVFDVVLHSRLEYFRQVGFA